MHNYSDTNWKYSDQIVWMNIAYINKGTFIDDVSFYIINK